MLSESSSDDSGPTDLESDAESDTADDWNVFGTEAESTETATHRLALCNMDWDNIRAADLMMLFNSFKSSDGSINSVKIYRSKFGTERMMLEEKNGPTELVKDGDHDEVSLTDSKYSVFLIVRFFYKLKFKMHQGWFKRTFLRKLFHVGSR